MCYEIGKKTRKRKGYKVVIKKSLFFSKYYKTPFTGNKLKKGKVGLPNNNAIFSDKRFYNRSVAFLNKKDAEKLLEYIDNFNYTTDHCVILEIKYSGDVRMGTQMDRSGFLPVISGTYIGSFKEVSE